METFIASINIYDYERFRDRVMKECNISRATWSNWINGKEGAPCCRLRDPPGLCRE